MKANIHTPPNILPLIKNHASDTIISSHAYSTSSLFSLPSDKMHLTTNQQDKNSMTSLTSRYQFKDNTHLDKKQTILSQYGQINTIKKNKKDKKKPKEKKDIGSPTKDKEKQKLNEDIVDSQTIGPLTKNSEEKAKHKPLCYKCKKLGHYQNNCKPPKNKSKLKTPDLHSEINSLKQEIQEIKTSSFQITEEQLA
jgi:hypothetical protein